VFSDAANLEEDQISGMPCDEEVGRLKTIAQCVYMFESQIGDHINVIGKAVFSVRNARHGSKQHDKQFRATRRNRPQSATTPEAEGWLDQALTLSTAPLLIRRATSTLTCSTLNSECSVRFSCLATCDAPLRKIAGSDLSCG
jgi:hypothetical protein